MKQKAKICALPWLLPYIIASVIFLPIAVATISPTHGLMLLAWVVIVSIALIHTFVLRLGKQVYITDHAVGFKTGIFSKDVTEMSLSKIDSIGPQVGLKLSEREHFRSRTPDQIENAVGMNLFRDQRQSERIFLGNFKERGDLFPEIQGEGLDR